MKRFKDVLKWVLLLGILGMMLWAGVILWPEQSEPASAQTTFTEEYVVKRGDITASIAPTGEVYAPHMVALAFKTSGVRLTAVNVKVGQRVRAGDMLAAIDTATLKSALDKAKANLLSAEEALEDAQNPYTELDKLQAEAAVSQAKANLEAARQKLEDLLKPDLETAERNVVEAQRNLRLAQEKLAALKADKSVQEEIDRLQWQANEAEVYHGEQLKNASGPNPSEQQLDYEWLTRNKMLDAQEAVQRAKIQAKLDLLKAEHDVVAAQDTLANAQKTLDELRAGPDPIEVMQAQNNVAQAEYELHKAQEDLKTILAGPDERKVKLAQARYDAAKAAYEDALAALNGATLTAPFDGTVVAVNGEVGDWVTSSMAVVTLADLSELRVQASIDETQISQVEVGQPVVMTFDALPGKRFQGQVLEVPLEGQLVNNVVIYKVDISLESVDPALKPGMTANLEIVVGSKKNVLLVPTMAIVQNLEGAFVTIRDASGSTALTPVEIGLRNSAYTEIVRGLNEGDIVLITYTAQQPAATATAAARIQRGEPMIIMGPGGPPEGGGAPPAR